MRITKIPYNVQIAFWYAVAVFAVLFTAGIILQLATINAPKEETWLYALFALLFMSLLAGFSFLGGKVFAMRSFKGRALEIIELTGPGTMLPQSENYFRFLGKHELGGGWAVGTFLKVTKAQTVLGTPPSVKKKDLFCAITDVACFPERQMFVRLSYDQRSFLKLKGLEEQNPFGN